MGMYVLFRLISMVAFTASCLAYVSHEQKEAAIFLVIAAVFFAVSANGYRDGVS